MGTKKVLLEPSVNAAIWDKGIKNVPHRLRVRLHRKRNDDESAKEDEKLYTLVSVVPTTNFKVGSNTTVSDADEDDETDMLAIRAGPQHDRRRDRRVDSLFQRDLDILCSQRAKRRGIPRGSVL